MERYLNLTVLTVPCLISRNHRLFIVHTASMKSNHLAATIAWTVPLLMALKHQCVMNL